MKRNFGIFYFVGVFLVSAIECVPTNGNSTDEATPRLLDFIGHCLGKSYFTEGTAMNWEGAKQYCIAMNMRLASIVSPCELKALKGAYDQTKFSGSYWISGRDSLCLRQVSWDDSGEAPDTSFMELRSTSGTEIHSCLSYFSEDGPDNGKVDLVRCSTTRKFLCENLPS